MLSVVLLIFVSGLVQNGLVFALDDEYARSSLRDLKGVYILIEHLTPDVERDGLSKDQLQADVELRLRQAGIKVLTRGESLKTLGLPEFYVNVTALKSKDGAMYVVSVNAEFDQLVTLVRNRNIKVQGTTWSVGGITTTGVPSLNKDARDMVGDVVDEFIDAYRAANLNSQ
jgi:hypothetical protein